MSNVALLPPKPEPPFRKIAIGTWKTSFDPQVYGTMSVRMEPALAYIEAFRERTGKRLTVTHLLAKAVALAFKKMPDANSILRWSRIHPRRDIDIFLQVVMTDPATGKADLSGVTLRRVDELTLEAIIEETEAAVTKVREHKDRALQKSRGMLASLPGWIVGPTLRMLSFLLYTLNLDLAWAGVARDGFGSVMITNIGSLGLEQAFVPLVPWSRVPMIVTAGAIVDEPVIEEGRVVPGKLMRLCATFDHRFIDGAHAAVLASTVREYFASPEKLAR
jgi:pyruvate/2-oxoglutarate dehydrogenase complex dihydrolipoamide acyltransferase (E2) component